MIISLLGLIVKIILIVMMGLLMIGSGKIGDLKGVTIGILGILLGSWLLERSLRKWD